MKLFKQIVDFYINSSIHVALSVFSLSWITLIEFDITYDKSILFFIGFASITGYNFVKYFGLAKFHHRRLADWLKTIQVFSFICFVLMSYYAFKLELSTLIYIAVFGIITFLYAVPFLPKHLFLDKNQNLRSISGLKIHIIAIVWSGVTVFLPLINNNFGFNTDVILTAFQRFLFVIVLMFPFEIRDLRYDSVKLSTVPQKIGVKRTKLIGILLLMLFFFLEYFKDNLSSEKVITSLIIMFITLLFLVFSRKNQGKYYSSFWVEGIPIAWLLLVIFT